jgi:multiple antibiotic resistance protein
MASAFSFGLLAFTSLFTMIDPLGVAPVFVAMTDRFDGRRRRNTAVKACLLALLVLIVFTLGGGLIFRAFGITIDSLRIAGGILFFVTALPMLTGAHRHAASSEGELHTDPSIVPIGIPLICGPGAISTVMVLTGQQSTALHTVAFFAALCGALALTALVLVVSPRIVRLAGRSGIEVITKVMGLIVCAIGIQFVIDGVRPVLLEILASAR